jgi:hypothetical protein
MHSLVLCILSILITLFPLLNEYYDIVTFFIVAFPPYLEINEWLSEGNVPIPLCSKMHPSISSYASLEFPEFPVINISGEVDDIERLSILK